MSENIYKQRSPDWYQPYLDRFEPFQPPLLDLGAGFGLFLQLATRSKIECRGVELLPERVEACRAAGLNVIQHDLSKPLPFSDGQFGMIFCNQVIEHMPFPTHKMLISEAYRVLRKNGIFQICSPCAHHRDSQDVDHIAMHTPKSLVALLKQAGFEKITEINYCQEIPEIPPNILKDIWLRFKPDILSESANAICVK